MEDASDWLLTDNDWLMTDNAALSTELWGLQIFIGSEKLETFQTMTICH